MATRPFPFRFAIAFAFSFSLTVSLSPLPTPSPLPKPVLASLRAGPPPTRTPRRKLTADLLALLAGPQEAARVAPKEAKAIMSCLRFLVPFHPPGLRGNNGPNRRELAASGRMSEWEEDMVLWPPEAVMELARIAVDSGGNPEELQRQLDPTMLRVPDVEGCKADKCQLTSTPYGRRFIFGCSNRS